MTFRFEPPIDLTDLPNFRKTDTRLRRPVFVGRVSTKDNQNPASSLPRQVVLASERLEAGEEFVGYFWDVESGMLPPQLRSLAPREMYEALAVPVPRDGGLQDLVDRAEQLGVTHVLAERSDRVARAMLTSLTVEHELGKAGVEVVYANEPVGGTESGRLRTRRYSQVDAEIYRTTLMEMSMGGQIQHAINGWNHGYPPYPYTTVVDETAPVPARGRFGATRPKRKLAPHPDSRRFDAARELCRLRREEQLKSAQIIAILAAEPDRYPIEGRWTHNLVEGLVTNPKLTGHQVYNRRATRTGRPGYSRQNPVSEWVWSPGIVHEPVVSLHEWKQAQEVTAALRAGSQDGGALLRIRAAARRLGLTVTAVSSSETHTVCRIGARKVVLPTPIPDMVVQQVIADMEKPT
ncbi:recombinase family protein [Nocardia abscessus]|uniref:recombinase family protein n=1 Tax=Nocardia abscessus TaxID=120957 RepID=UPI001894CC18|nr:recombinase family protein [Nocardia abscessus]MBF6339775.1 recombinase family protein [Nocardia abscessus]